MERRVDDIAPGVAGIELTLLVERRLTGQPTFRRS
jgi:hypothetical protein